jgi:hypothetical protein
MNPEEYLQKGAEILGELLYPLGFRFEVINTHVGSGGKFAIGSFTKGDREIRLWYRYELGSVVYRKGDIEKSHAEFMQYLGREKESSWPGFVKESKLDSFRYVLEDLRHCDIFLDDEGDKFYKELKDYQYKPPPKGLGALSEKEKDLNNNT